MALCNDNKFWLENLSVLFSSIQLVPTQDMNLAEQLNAITRLILVLFIIMLLFDFDYSAHFLIISITVLIILYYLQRNNMSNKNCAKSHQESYKPVIEYFQPAPPAPGPIYDTSKLAQQAKKVINGQTYNEIYVETPEELYFCQDYQDLENNNQLIGLNQRLTIGTNGQTQNPNTYIKPVVIPPIADLEYWRDNDFIVMSQINTAGIQEDMYLSGYAPTTCCGYLPPGTKLVPETKEGYKSCGIVSPSLVQQRGQVQSMPVENYQKPRSCGIVSPSLVQQRGQVQSMPVRENYGGCGIVSPSLVQQRGQVQSMPVENYQRRSEPRPAGPGMMNTACGYNPDQTDVYLPSNLPVGNCQQDPRMAEYNRNLFTQTITPGVYTRNQVNEPINSNIGISFQQQFEPVTCSTNDDGSQMEYVQHDPRIIEPDTSPSVSVMQNPKYDNVYDPRFYGYGTSYRSYNEPVTGQTRFMYDDINAIRMPNYVARSKIDHLPYADTYGPMVEGSEMGNIHNPNIRALAQDSWMRDSLQFRNDLTERRMRKINSEAWQQRMAPLGPRQV